MSGWLAEISPLPMILNPIVAGYIGFWFGATLFVYIWLIQWKLSKSKYFKNIDFPEIVKFVISITVGYFIGQGTLFVLNGFVLNKVRWI